MSVCEKWMTHVSADSAGGETDTGIESREMWTALLEDIDHKLLCYFCWQLRLSIWEFPDCDNKAGTWRARYIFHVAHTVFRRNPMQQLTTVQCSKMQCKTLEYNPAQNSVVQYVSLDTVTEWTLQPMLSLLTMASRRKGWKRISAESAIMSSSNWTELNWRIRYNRTL